MVELLAGRRVRGLSRMNGQYYMVCSAGRTNNEVIETAASRMCYTQSWVCIVVELKSRELAGWMAYKKNVGHPEGI
jgi:hypothetical protein